MDGGGSYIIQADGTRVLAEEPTRPHAAGDAPRTAEGQVIGADGQPIGPALPKPPRRARKPRAPKPAPGPAPAPAEPQQQEA